MDNVQKAINSEKQFGRQPAGTSAFSASYPTSDTGKGTPVLRKGEVKGGSPDLGAGTQAMPKGTSERLGAAYAVKASFPAQTPQAQATQANGKIIPATHSGGKQFWSQA